MYHEHKFLREESIVKFHIRALLYRRLKHVEVVWLSLQTTVALLLLFRDNEITVFIWFMWVKCEISVGYWRRITFCPSRAPLQDKKKTNKQTLQSACLYFIIIWKFTSGIEWKLRAFDDFFLNESKKYRS